MDQNKHYPNIKQALVLILLFLGLQVVLGIPLALLSLFLKFPTTHPAALAVVNVAAFGGVVWWGLRKSRASFGSVFPLTPVSLPLLGAVAMTILGMSILVSEADNLFRLIVPVPESFANFLRGIIGSQSSLWGSILILVIVAPLTEEFLFRGLFLHGFLSHYSVKKAILVSAVLFGLIHLNPWQFLGATVLGIVFAWWFVHTRSLVPCLFGHALNNALPIIYGRLLQLEIPGYSDESLEHVQHQPLWFDGLGLLLAGLGIWLTIQMFKKGSKNIVSEVPFVEQPDRIH